MWQVIPYSRRNSIRFRIFTSLFPPSKAQGAPKTYSYVPFSACSINEHTYKLALWSVKRQITLKRFKVQNKKHGRNVRRTTKKSAFQNMNTQNLPFGNHLTYKQKYAHNIHTHMCLWWRSTTTTTIYWEERKKCFCNIREYARKNTATTIEVFRDYEKVRSKSNATIAKWVQKCHFRWKIRCKSTNFNERSYHFSLCRMAHFI